MEENEEYAGTVTRKKSQKELELELKNFQIADMPMKFNTYYNDHWRIETPYNAYIIEDTKLFDDHGDQIFTVGSLDENGNERTEGQMYAKVFLLIMKDADRYNMEKNYPDEKTR